MDERNPGGITLRDVVEADLPILFEQQLDEAFNYMAAFVSENPADREAFMAHWQQILDNKDNINKAILLDGQVVGSMMCFEMFGKRSVGYGVDRAYWGRGIATQALRTFLSLVTERPLYARVVKDNTGSVRVLQKCGFMIVGEDKGFANARGQEVEEYIFELK
jgi:RimJ/RimL family protein N-acetyltransferase